MVARATEQLDGVIIRPFLIPATKIATEGHAVKHSGADNQIENTDAVGDNLIGIALKSGVAGETVPVALISAGIVRVKVGSAGLARGSFAKWSASGAVAATIGGGTTKLVVWGQAIESGVSGDFVGLNLAMAGATVGS